MTKSEIKNIPYFKCKRRHSKRLLFFSLPHFRFESSASRIFLLLFNSALYRLFFSCRFSFWFFFLISVKHIRGFTWIDRWDDSDTPKKCVCVCGMSLAAQQLTRHIVWDYNFGAGNVWFLRGKSFVSRISFCVCHFFRVLLSCLILNRICLCASIR